MELLVSPAPHRMSKLNANEMYIIVSIMLMSCVTYGYLIFSLPVLWIALATVGSAVVCEMLCNVIVTKKLDYPHTSCFVTGLILTCIMPVNMPIYFAVVAAVLAIVYKYIFGGIGNNLFNPSAVARSFVVCLSSGFIFDFFADGNTALNAILSGNKASLELEKLFTGDISGAIGTTCIILILVSFLALVFLRIIKWEGFVFAVLSFGAVVWAWQGFDYVLPMLLSGSFLFVTVFMLNDPTTSPYGFSSRCLNSIFFGVIAALMMINNIMGESAVFFALLIVNMLAPLVDRCFSVFHRGVKEDD